MATDQTFLAVFTGSMTSPRMQEWLALSEADREARSEKAMTAWRAWMQRHGESVVFDGGPLGKTKRISPSGVEDVTNELAGVLVLRAESHEAAARMFQTHPHFTLFPGEAIEVMPILAIPQG